jgi:hypothetical protein
MRAIWNVRQNEALAAIIRRSPARNNSGSFDEAITARVLAASTWEEVKPMTWSGAEDSRGESRNSAEAGSRPPWATIHGEAYHFNDRPPNTIVLGLEAETAAEFPSLRRRGLIRRRSYSASVEGVGANSSKPTQ